MAVDAEGGEKSGADGAGIGVEVREPRGMDELRALEALQLEVWGFETREVVPAAHFRAVQHAGGMVLGAFAQGRLAGFAYAFPALPHGAWQGGTGLHSHMVAVRPAFRGSGVGRRLKWAQRTWCLARGIDWITWTFDPIQARNARLNFHHLGVRSREYLVDFYGSMAGALGGNQATDRLLAFWDLGAGEVSQRAERFAVGLGPEPAPLPRAPWVLERSESGEPLARPAVDGATALRVAVPEDATRLFGSEPEAAARWRHAVRDAMAPRVGHGYVVTAFEGGAYLLEKENAGKGNT